MIEGVPLVGTIPASLGNASSLEQLHASFFLCFWRITLLNIFFSRTLEKTQLEGPIPQQLGNLTVLRVLYDSPVRMAMADSILMRCCILSQLKSNQLSGAIPSRLGNILSLQDLYVSPHHLCR